MSDVAVVTGAGSGIGFATLEALLTSGAGHCVGLDVAEGWSDPLRDRFGSDRVSELRVDVADHSQVVDAAAAVAAEHGAPNRLVNSAGIQLNRPVLELTFADWRRVLSINLDGVFNSCQQFGRLMVESGSGAIVNVGSVSMFFGFPNRVPYITSKTGLQGLTQALAVEWAQAGVRVNSVAPGFVETPFTQENLARGHVNRGEAESQHALGRMAAPSEIAEVIGFLLSAGASFITGECVVVDGGFRHKKI